MNVVVIIPAKGDSKRLEKKNIRELWGKPLIEWAFDACKESKYVTDVYVSTEDRAVRAVCDDNNIKVVHRDDRLCGEAYKQKVIRDVVNQVGFLYGNDTLWVSLQANSPQVTGPMLDGAIDKLLDYDRDEVFSVDPDGNQNGAFRIFRGEYVLQLDLSTNCGTYQCDVLDVHNEEDIETLSKLEVSCE